MKIRSSCAFASIPCLLILGQSCLTAANIAVNPLFGTPCQIIAVDTVAQTCSVNNGVGFSGSAYAQGDLFSGLHSESQAIYTSTSFQVGGVSGADADVIDTVTLHGAPASGFLKFSFAVEGILSLATNTGNLNDHVDELVSVNVYDGSVLVLGPGSSSLTVNQIQTVLVPYSGTTFPITMALNTLASCANSPTTLGTTCTATADFRNTATVAEVDILNSNSILVPGASMTSSSGFTYPSAIPEPSGALLCSAGLLAIIFRRCRRRTTVRDTRRYATFD